MRYHNSYSDYLCFRSYGTNLKTNLPLSNRDEIERYFEYKNNKPAQSTLRIDRDQLAVYANDVAILEQAFTTIAPNATVRFYSAVIPKESDTIEFAREPKFKYRNYFKSKRVGSKFKTEIAAFIKDQQLHGAEIEPSAALAAWLKSPSARNTTFVCPGLYIDYNDSSFTLVLSMMFDEIIAPAAYKLVKRTA